MVNRPKLLSLCTGYAGLDHAAEEVFGAETVAVSDIDPGANRILAHRYPHVPNLGDLKLIDWDAWAGTEIMTAGYPCQPFSNAGKRAGTDDPRHIFPYIAEGIRRVGPRLVLLENVRGHLRLGFDVVLGTLADIGYDARWVCVRASDVGACHKRERLFIAATPADAHGSGLEPVRGFDTFGRDAHGRGRAYGPGASGQPASLLPTPRTSDANGAGRHGDGGLDLRTAVELLPTPRASDGDKGGPNQRGSSGDLMLPSAVVQQFGKYAAAIARQEAAFGYPAPAPTEPTGRDGAHRLSPRFVEWMQGCEPGWVTDPAIWDGMTQSAARNAQLKALGNGVVRQQAAAAMRFLSTPLEAVA